MRHATGWRGVGGGGGWGWGVTRHPGICQHDVIKQPINPSGNLPRTPPWRQYLNSGQGDLAEAARNPDKHLVFCWCFFLCLFVCCCFFFETPGSRCPPLSQSWAKSNTWEPFHAWDSHSIVHRGVIVWQSAHCNADPSINLRRVKEPGRTVTVWFPLWGRIWSCFHGWCKRCRRSVRHYCHYVRQTAVSTRLLHQGRVTAGDIEIFLVYMLCWTRIVVKSHRYHTQTF